MHPTCSVGNSVTAALGLAPLYLVTALSVGGSSKLQSIIVSTDHVHAKPGIHLEIWCGTAFFAHVGYRNPC